MGKNIGKNISKNLSGKYSQKRLDHAKQSAADALKTVSTKSNSKNSRSNWDLIRTKIADKVTKV